MSLVGYPDLSEKAYEILRNQILTALLAPGSPLVVAGLAYQLGVSRTPVKNALNRLVAEGLVENLPRKGYFVASLDAEDIADLLQARLMLELAAVRKGLRSFDRTRLDDMRRVVDEMNALVDASGQHGNYPRFAELDSQFHLLIIDMAENRHLSDAYRQMSVHLHIHRVGRAANVTNSRTLPTLREHRAILSALKARNLPSVERAISEHVRKVAESFTTAHP